MGRRHSDKFTIRFVKIGQFHIVGKAGKSSVVIISQGYLITSVAIRIVAQDPFDKGITRPITALGLGFVLILLQDAEAIINRYPFMPHDGLQPQGALLHTSGRDILMLAIGHQHHIGIDNCCQGHHWPFPFSRSSMAATVLAVNSAISSPKKFSGQFSISPNRLTCKGSSSTAAPLRLQK